MSRSSFLIVVLLLLAATKASLAACVSGAFYVVADQVPACNYTALLTAFTTFFQDPINAPPSACGSATAEQVLWQLLQVSSAASAQTTTNNICTQAVANYNKDVITLDQIVSGSGNTMEANANFVKNFYLGRTDWNEEYETLYASTPAGINYTNILAEDAAVVNAAYLGAGTYGKIVFPSELPMFSNCQLNSVYCCWPSDRQPNDGNGDCEYPTDSECVDAKPDDNTNLCLTQHAAASSSTTWKSSSGQFIFPGDDAEGEGPIHCHGFVWDEFNQNDPSVMLKGNSLFYISMYDHLYNRGYVRNIPGAPMCGCAEQMPVVTRSDCTELDVLNNIKFIFDGTVFTAEITSVNVAYNACQGTDRTGKPDSNDLWAHYNSLFYQGRVSASKFQGFSQHVLGTGDDLCRVYERANMASSGLAVGYAVDTSAWYQVAGREALALPGVIGMNLFNLVYSSAAHLIVRRVCPNCLPTHHNIYYRRITPVPSGFDLLNSLLNSAASETGQQYGSDFYLYSTYTDAVNRANAWPCNNFNPQDGFPYGCGPHKDGYDDQSSNFVGQYGRQDVGFYVEASATSNALATRSSLHIGPKSVTTNGMAVAYRNSVYITGVGNDFEDPQDSFDYSYSTVNTANVNAIVQVSNLVSDQGWAKAGLDLRATTGSSTIHFGIFLTKANGVQIEWRNAANGYSDSNGDTAGKVYTSVWLRLNKSGNTLNGYISKDGKTWTNVGSAQSISFPTPMYIGLAVAADYSDYPAEAVFTNFTIQ